MYCETQDFKISREYFEALEELLPDYLDGLSDQYPQPFLFVTRCNAVELCDPSFYSPLACYVSTHRQIGDLDNSR